MIIDAHGHIVAPSELYEWQAKLFARRTSVKGKVLSDDLLGESLAKHLKLLDNIGTDVQFISPRPYTMAHSMFNASVVQSWTTFVNDNIARQVELSDGRLRAVLGLPQFRTTSLDPSLDEIDRCAELGFVGTLINPDPNEGEGPPPPGLGNEYWYPLYQKLVDHDMPALIHSASCSAERESYSLHFINEESIAVMSLLNSRVFTDFPTLKIMVAHGGGAIPYQAGRFRAGALKSGKEEFLDKLKKLHYDTVLYSKEGLELLFKVVGTDNVLFGSETPGTGSAVDPADNRSLDDIKPVIDSLTTITDEDRTKIYETNVKKLYPRAFN